MNNRGHRHLCPVLTDTSLHPACWMASPLHGPPLCVCLCMCVCACLRVHVRMCVHVVCMAQWLPQAHTHFPSLSWHSSRMVSRCGTSGRLCSRMQRHSAHQNSWPKLRWRAPFPKLRWHDSFPKLRRHTHLPNLRRHTLFPELRWHPLVPKLTQHTSFPKLENTMTSPS